MIIHVQRREFMAALGSVAATWSFAAQAQQAKRPTIGFLGADASGWRPWTAVFVQRLRELGWVEGRTIAIEYRWSHGRPEHDAEIAAEFVRQKADIIVTHGAAAPAVKQATSVIPIVFAIALDPIGSGLASNLARPGGNVTGLSRQSTELGPKRLQFLRELVPGLRCLALMATPTSGSDLERDEVQAAARTLGIDIAGLEIRRAEDIAPAMAALKARTNALRADALYVVTNALMGANRTRIITSALDARLPTMFSTRDLVQAGGLMSYGPSFPDMFRRTAELVDLILRGTKPGDIPVAQPAKFELAINLKTAKALGIAVPRILLAAADEVIE